MASTLTSHITINNRSITVSTYMDCQWNHLDSAYDSSTMETLTSLFDITGSTVKYNNCNLQYSGATVLTNGTIINDGNYDIRTNLTGTKWILNVSNYDDATIKLYRLCPLSIDMIVDGLYTGNNITSSYGGEDTWIHLNNDNTYTAMIIGTDGQGCTSVEITGGNGATNSELISWFEQYAVLEDDSNYRLAIYSNDDRTTHYKIYANGTCVATLPRINVAQENSELTMLRAPATQNGNEVKLE